jgi:hypothetical protein
MVKIPQLNIFHAEPLEAMYSTEQRQYVIKEENRGIRRQIMSPVL